MKSVAEVRAELTAPGQLFEMDEVGGLRVWKYAPPTLRSILEGSRGYGDASFLVYEDERLSFAEHFALAAGFARRLTDLGVRKGDRVALVMRNYPEWSVAFWGAAAIGAVVVPLNGWWTAPELEYGVRDSGASVLVADRERADRMSGLDLPVIVARDGSWLPADELPDADIAPEDDATIFYTSGTTGRPKGALGTQRNITTNPMSLAYATIAAGLRAGRTVEEVAAPQRRCTLLSVPLFHATGCHSVLVTSVLQGATIVLMRKWNPERALELIEREKVTLFGGVPTMAWQALTSPAFADYDTSSLTGVSYGGAPAPPKLVEKIKELLPGRTPSNGYGLTETSSVTTYNSGVDYLAKPDSVGPPVAVCDVRVVDPDGRDLPAGEVGELLISGPNVIKGYWHRPEETARAFADGWFHSGDLARLDDEGFVYIVDRAKDMLIRGGENIYCAEVEAALYEHPAVADCAVIGVPHDELGEEVGAVIRLSSPATSSVSDTEPGAEVGAIAEPDAEVGAIVEPTSPVTAEDLRAFLAPRIAAFKIPQHFWFRAEELPRNPGGKLLKTRLRAELLGTD